MNRNELIDVVATRLEQSRQEASEALDAVVDEIKKAVAQGDKVTIPGFGVFENIAQAARESRAVKSIGAAAEDTHGPRFKAGADFKALVAGARKAVIDRTKKAAPAKKSASAKKPAPAKKSAPAKKAASAKKSATKKASSAKKTTAKKASTAKQSATKKATSAKKATTKKATAAKSTATKKATAAKKTATAKATSAKDASSK